MRFRDSVRPLASALVVFLAIGSLQQLRAASPVIPGFERFGKTDAAAGELLLNELNCIACHAPADSASLAKQAPVLDSVGSRIKGSYFQKFLADPQKVKPGTTMPHVFAGDPEAAAKVEAIAHFLASTGTPKLDSSNMKSAIQGRETYHNIGCVACHGTRDAAGQADKTTSATIPLGDLKAKYTISSLAAFLANPHAARPSGRMPSLLVVGNGKERMRDALDLANYLIQGVNNPSIPKGKGTTAYSYYEGSWESLPDFDKLRPLATGIGNAFDLSVAKRYGNMALKFDGVFLAPSDGTYNFQTSSDDGSRILIDGKTVVDNDGVHPVQAASGSVPLKKGLHKITLLYFQGGGEHVLSAEVNGPSMPPQPLGGIVAANEKELDRVVQKQPPVQKGDDAFEVNSDLVAKGRQLFASEGCMNCHQMKDLKNEAKSATPLAKLQSTGGCLSKTPTRGLPWFGLSDTQKTALSAVIMSPVAPPKQPADIITKTLITFNCYACHSRDKIGGPEDALNEAFLTAQKEMGDEARVPPPLDNVGGKINLDYLKKILNEGSHDRPYMMTRMPAFGAQNVGPLVAALAEADKGKFPNTPAITFEENDAKIKGVGRHLVGAKAFSCYKCHTFAGQKAEGVQGIDMTLFPARLQRDWFHAYLADPQKIRPGTRMPSAFDKGKSPLGKILDGTAAQQTEAMWAYLKDGKSAQLPEGFKKQSMPLTPIKDAIVYRNFIQGAGNRAIAVGYPEHVSLAFDANDMRLAMIWQGSFIDASRHWTGRGEGSEPPLGDNILHLPTGSAFAVLSKADVEWPKTPVKSQGFKFNGYTLSPDDRPTFLYSLGDVKIVDFPNALVNDKETGIRRTFNVTASKETAGLYYRAAVGDKIAPIGNGTYLVNGNLRTKITSSATPIVRSSAGKMELLVPIAFTNGKAQLVQEYAW